MTVEWIMLLLGRLGVGTLSGLIGIGGDDLITPALVHLFGCSQPDAPGTTRALFVPPLLDLKMVTPQ